MTDERIWQLIILKFTGEAGSEELAELEQLLKQQPGLGFQLGILEEVWAAKQKKDTPDIDDSFNRHLQRLSNQVPVDNHIPSRKPLYKRAWFISTAAAACLLVFALLFYQSPPKQPPAAPAVQNLVSTHNGSKTKLQLPDGSEVWLNAGSKISYGNDFTGPERRVTLYGEAFFDVVKDSTRPFIIHTNAIDIRVLGTAFNVRSYPDEKMTETALIRGSIEVTLRKHPGRKIVLKPSEKLIVKNDTLSAKITGKPPDPLMTLTQVHYVNEGRDSASMETLWTKNKLVFDGETLQEVAVKLERWYGVKVTIQSELLKNTEYNGVFEDENINEVLYALQLTGNFNYTIKKKEVIIKP
jgi:Fe2+-dicitrate sensor, membrane component